MPLAGIAVETLAVLGLIGAWALSPRLHSFGAVGWAGLAAAGLSVALLASPWRAPALGALAWSGYVVAADSAVFSLRGRSMIRSGPQAFAWLVILSIFLWLPFEWYNLRLAGWYRSGMPAGLERYLLLGWSFACIWPALFETSDLFLALARRDAPAAGRGSCPGVPAVVATVAAGGACLVVPLLVPRLDVGEHLLPLVAVGFLLVLDPLNAISGGPSLWRGWSNGGRERLVGLAAAGVFCGLLADGLNYPADAKWHGIASLGAGLKLFEMPLAGYAACAVFGPQAYAMHGFTARLLGRPLAAVPSGPAAAEGRGRGGPVVLR